MEIPLVLLFADGKPSGMKLRHAGFEPCSIGVQRFERRAGSRSELGAALRGDVEREAIERRRIKRIAVTDVFRCYLSELSNRVGEVPAPLGQDARTGAQAADRIAYAHVV